MLDEIGDAPLEVQASLLRVLETAEIQPAGGEPRTIDVAWFLETERADEEESA